MRVGRGSEGAGRHYSRLRTTLLIAILLAIALVTLPVIMHRQTQAPPMQPKIEGAPASLSRGLSAPTWDDLSVSVFVLKKGTQQVGTGFAVANSILATAAHVAQELMNGGGKAVQSDSAATCTFARADIRISTTYKVQSSFADQYANDIALITVSCPDPLKPVTFASASEMRSLGRGTPVDVLSFPTADFLAGAPKPVAFLSGGTVGAPFGASLFLHTAAVAPGASGAPIFNEQYHVIGIVEGGDALQLVGSGGASVRVPAGDSVNFGLRVDALQDFMHQQGVH